ncbi:MAG: TolC family protein [Defluviitaleaceae bacterium]|nr:TolC family protein [Defluviitaleaceae bacterium]
MKKIIALGALAIMIFAFATPVTAQETPSDTIEFEIRIATLEAMLESLMAQLTAIPAPAAGHAAVSVQRQETEQLERLMFRFQYYGVCFAIAQNEFLAHHQALTERQLALEKIRLELGFTTQNNLDDLTAVFNNLESQIELNHETIETQREHVNTRRGRQGYEFIRDFAIPTPGSASVNSADELRRHLTQSNATLTVLNSALNQARGHINWDETDLMEEQRDLLLRQLELAAITAWNNYQSARTQHDLAVSEAPLLETRLNLIDDMYELGEISTIDKMASRFAIYAEQHAADAAAITLSMAIAEIEFMRRGILGFA